eukprot:7743148-Pyramimonas_sp.AAC.1
MSASVVPAASAGSTALVSSQGGRSRHGSPLIKGRCVRGSVRPACIALSYNAQFGHASSRGCIR